MKKSELIAALHKKFCGTNPQRLQMSFLCCVKGVKGVVIPGCSTCRKRANAITSS